MKKTLLTLFAGILFSTWSVAGVENYTLQNSQIDNLFASSEDITMTLSNEMSIENIGAVTEVSEGGKTVGGFLLRSFFCGGIALHRYYMGTNGKSMWWKYLCIPGVGAVANCGDFFWVLFKGDDALSKYTNNGKYIVW